MSAEGSAEGESSMASPDIAALRSLRGPRVVLEPAPPTALPELSAASIKAFLFAAICSRIDTLLGDLGGTNRSVDELDCRKVSTDACDRIAGFGLMVGDPRSLNEEAAVRRRDGVCATWGASGLEDGLADAGLGRPTELEEGLLVRLGEEVAPAGLAVLDETSGLAFREGVTGTVLTTLRTSNFVAENPVAMAEGVARGTFGEEVNVAG